MTMTSEEKGANLKRLRAESKAKNERLRTLYPQVQGKTSKEIKETQNSDLIEAYALWLKENRLKKAERLGRALNKLNKIESLILARENGILGKHVCT